MYALQVVCSCRGCVSSILLVIFDGRGLDSHPLSRRLLIYWRLGFTSCDLWPRYRGWLYGPPLHKLFPIYSKYFWWNLFPSSLIILINNFTHYTRNIRPLYNLIVAQLVKIFSIFYRIWMFIAVFTRMRHWMARALKLMSPVQTVTPYFLNINFNIC